MQKPVFGRQDEPAASHAFNIGARLSEPVRLIEVRRPDTRRGLLRDTAHEKDGVVRDRIDVEIHERLQACRQKAHAEQPDFSGGFEFDKTADLSVDDVQRLGVAAAAFVEFGERIGVIEDELEATVGKHALPRMGRILIGAFERPMVLHERRQPFCRFVLYILHGRKVVLFCQAFNDV